MDGAVVKVYRFADDSEMPWFQAKPIATFLDYSNIARELRVVDTDDKCSLDELVLTEGQPRGRVVHPTHHPLVTTMAMRSTSASTDCTR